MLLSITIAKTGRTYEREVEALPAESVAYLLRNGYSQRMRDVHASIKSGDFKTREEFEAAVTTAVEGVLAQLDTGDVPGARTTPNSDTARLRAAVKRSGMTLDEAIAFLERTTDVAEAA